MALQKLLFDIEECVKKWTPYEKTIRKKLMHNICAIYLSYSIAYIIGGWLFILYPLITDRILPLNVVYPFPISNFWVYCVAYTINVFSITQSSTVVVSDMIIIAILWQAVFKFKLLGMQIPVLTAEELGAYIITYQNIFKYVHIISQYLFVEVVLKKCFVEVIAITPTGYLILSNCLK